MAYAALADLRAYGLTVAQSSDVAAQSALDATAAIIDSYTGQTFGAPVVKTVRVYDVSSDKIILPTPFSNITQVTIGGAVLAGGYTVEEWGIRLAGDSIKDVDGFVIHNVRRRRKATVAVTATFGYTTPPFQVVRANVILGADWALGKATEALDPAIKSLSREGYAITFDRTGGPVKLTTTGNLEADQLLGQLIRGGAMVI